MRLPKLVPALAVLAGIVALLAGGWRLGMAYSKRLPLAEAMERILNQPLVQFGNLSLSVAFLFKAAVFVLVLVLFARRLRAFLRAHVLDRVALDAGQRYAIERGAGYLVLLLGLVVGLQAAGLDLSTLTVFGGAVGIGIGVGLQDIANNFIAGLILLFERPVKVGDRVEVGALNGEVTRIGPRSTWVRTNDNIVVILPNSEFITRQVVNWTAIDRTVRFVVPVGVSYASDPRLVREILLAVAAGNPDVLASPRPDVIFTGFGESSLDFQLRVWTATKVDVPQVLKSELYFAIFEAFRERGIEIPFPQRDLHLRSATPAALAAVVPPPTPAVPSDPPGSPR